MNDVISEALVLVTCTLYRMDGTALVKVPTTLAVSRCGKQTWDHASRSLGIVVCLICTCFHGNAGGSQQKYQETKKQCCEKISDVQEVG